MADEQVVAKKRNYKRDWILLASVLINIVAITGLVMTYGYFIEYAIKNLSVFFVVLAILIAVLEICMFGLLDFLIVYFWWAPNDLFFTLVEEGFAKVVVRGDGFRKCVIQWEGYTFDEDWNVVKEGTVIKDGQQKSYFEPKHWIGGLRLYGIWPFDEIKYRKIRWSSVRETGEISRHDEYLDRVLLKDFGYYVEMEGAEDSNMVPITVQLVIFMRVVNPRQAWFEVEDWLEAALQEIRSTIRGYVATETFQKLTREKQAAADAMWKELENLKLVGPKGKIQQRWGAQIIDGGLRIKDIVVPPQYQEAASKKYLGEQERQRESQESMGILIQMLADTTGKTFEETQREINLSLDLKDRLFGVAEDLVQRKIAIQGNSFIDIRTGGAQGVEKAILDIIGAVKRMPQGGKSEKGDEAKEDDEEKMKTIKENTKKLYGA